MISSRQPGLHSKTPTKRERGGKKREVRRSKRRRKEEENREGREQKIQKALSKL